MLRLLDAVSQHTRLRAHMLWALPLHTRPALTALTVPPHPVLITTSGILQDQNRGRCEDRVSPRLTCWTPAETQEKFLAQITSLPPKLRPPSGLGFKDGEI